MKQRRLKINREKFLYFEKEYITSNIAEIISTLDPKIKKTALRLISIFGTPFLYVFVFST